MTLFETNQLIIRRFELSDANDFYALNSHTEVMRYIRPVKTKEECQQFLQENINLYLDGSVIGRYHVAEKSTGTFAGTFSVLMMPDRDAFHIGYALMPWAQGKGWAKELLLNGLSWLTKQSERPIIYAITESVNIPSVTLLQRSGFLFQERIGTEAMPLDVYQINRIHVREVQE